MGKTMRSQTAVSMYFLATNLLNYFNERGSVSEIFGESEDGYLDELYPFADAIEIAWITQSKGEEGPGVWHYEIADVLAPKLFIEMIQNNDGSIDPRPNLEKWETNIKTVVDLWFNEKINFDRPILPQLNPEFNHLEEIAITQKKAALEKLLEPLHSAKIKNMEIVRTPQQNLTEIFICDKLYAAVDFKIIGHEAITTVDFRGMPDGGD